MRNLRQRAAIGNNISHAHNVTKRRWNVNLRPVHAKLKGGNKRIAFARPACAAVSRKRRNWGGDPETG